MLNHAMITVPCRLYPGTEGTFHVYYCKIDDSWQPLPVDICNNGCGDRTCLDCAVEVFRRASQQEPPSRR